MNKRSVLWIWLAIALMAMFFSWQTTSASAQTQQPDKPLADVVVKAENGKLAIYVQTTDGLDLQLAATVPFNKAPVLLSDFVALAPDGGRVAYVTMDDPYTRENAVLWIAQADGSGTEAIARFAQGYWLAAPQWSPDGQQLAFVKEIEATEPQERLELWTMQADDGSDQRLVLRGGVLRPEIFANSSRPLSWTDDGVNLRLDDQTMSPPQAYTFSAAGGGLITTEETIKDPVLAAQAEETRANLPCAVQLWHQNDYGQNMRTCNQSIASAGCALTSTAMVFKYYGVNTDPPTLNSCLGNSACPIYWGTAASNCSEGKVSYVGAPGFNYGAIEQDLSAGKPVIVYLTRPDNTHFVVVTGGSGQSASGYSINDPARYNPLRQTLAAYTNQGWGLSTLLRFSGTPSCPGDDGGAISYGQSRNGTINPAGDTDDFYFDASAGDVVEIRQNKASGSNLDSYLQLYRGNSLIAYDDDSGGSLNSFIRRTLDSGGQYRIRAKAYGSSTGAYTLSLQRVTSGGGGGCGGDCEGDPRWIAINQTLNGTISPNNDRDTYFFSGTAGRVVSIRMNKTGGTLDSYLELWSLAGVRVAYNDDGGGDRNSWIVYTLPASGTYRISAYSYSNASSGTYSLRLESTTGGGSSGNLARGKPVAVSSVEFGGVEGWKATDGNLGTRWSSRFSDPQWIYVDLGQDRYFNQVVLKWETAYGRRFGIYYQSTSMCSSCWNNVYWTDSGGGGTNTINFSRVRARYVLMHGVQRGTGWGYSLWEFEIYDTTTTTVPLVPPDDPGKEPNSAPLQLPLAPVEGDKEVTLDGEGALGQEYSPLPGDVPASVGEERQDVQTVVAFIRSPDLDELYKLYTPAGHIRFTGEASSQGAAGPLTITAYEWRSDRNGVIRTEAEFILPVTALSPGLHTITLRAQNELGVWSEEVSTTLEVNWPYRSFLPAILR